MVQKKLSGVFSTVEIEVPFTHYDDFIDEMMDQIVDLELQVSRVDVAENPDVIASFEKAVTRAVENIDFDYLTDNIDCHRLVCTAFAEAVRIKAEQEEIKIKKSREEEAERNKLAEVKRKEEAAKLALTQASISLPHKNYIKAMAILVAAGLVKKEA